MIFSVEKEVAGRFSFYLSVLGKKVAEQVLMAEGYPFRTKEDTIAAQIALRLTSDDGIRRINADFRGMDTVTDVLSFPSVSYEKPADFTHFRDDVTLYDEETECFFWVISY